MPASSRSSPAARPSLSLSSPGARSSPSRTKPSSKPPRNRGRSLPPRANAPKSAVARPDTAPPKSEPVTDTRRRTLSRDPIAVDHVGKAVNIPDAVGVAGRSVPKIVRSKEEIAAAPIDHRAGFLLAHIDGVTTVQGLIDIAGMAEEDVHEILERLRRLGILTIR